MSSSETKGSDFSGFDPATTAEVYDKYGETLLGSYPIVGGVFTADNLEGSDVMFKVGADTQKIHISCSDPIGPGFAYGFFKIIDWNADSANSCPCDDVET